MKRASPEDGVAGRPGLSIVRCPLGGGIGSAVLGISPGTSFSRCVEDFHLGVERRRGSWTSLVEPVAFTSARAE